MDWSAGAAANLTDVAVVSMTDHVGALIASSHGLVGAHYGCVIDRCVIDPSQALDAPESTLDMARGR